MHTLATYSIQQCADIIFADPKSDVAAKAYASAIAANRLLADPPSIEGIENADRIQALYILSNLSHWRNAEAKRVRASLKVIAGQKLSKKEMEALAA